MLGVVFMPLALIGGIAGLVYCLLVLFENRASYTR